MTATDERVPANCKGEGLTDTDRVPNGIVRKTLTSDIPPKVVNHPLGLEEIVKSLTRVYRANREQISKFPEKGTNEAQCRFLTYVD